MSNILKPNQLLRIGDSLTSENGAFTLNLESDGNLVLRDYVQDTIWSTQTQRKGVDRACMQGDGNFVLYNGDNAIWSTDTWKAGGDRIVLQNDRNLVLYRDGDAVWSSKTDMGWEPNKSWMHYLSGSKKLSDISIPGTHDTCSLYGIPQVTDIPILRDIADAEAIIKKILGGSIAVCQKMSLAYQLLSGVRMLDIRCRHISDKFAIHHGAVFQQQFFGEHVLKTLHKFISQYSHETLVVILKEEHKPENNNRSFQESLMSYIQNDLDKWYLEDRIPSLEEVRGKIVLIRRFKGDVGINAMDDWNPEGGTFTINDADSAIATNKLRVQDQYEVKNSEQGYDEKWSKIKHLFREAERGHSNVWHVNFLSGTTGLAIEKLLKNGVQALEEAKTCPEKVAKHMNPLAAKWLEGKRQRVGSVMMDFADPILCDCIISTNG